MSGLLVEARDLHKVFPMPAGPVVAVQEVCLTIHTGEYTAIKGPSGCGKSTLLHLLGCVETPTAGTLRFDGREVGTLREGRLREVAEILGLDGLVVETLPDSKLARCGLDEVASKIRAVLDELKPQVLIGHDPRGVNAHPDHIATHWALRHALLDRPPIRFAMLAYLQELTEMVKPRLLFATPEEDIDAVVHLSAEEADAKERALRVHEAFVTLRDDGEPSLLRRPPVERYDFLGEDCPEPLDDLFS